MHRTALALVFGAFGLMFGIWQVVLPDLTLALGIDEGRLGFALAVGFLAAFPSMWLAGRAVDRLGSTPVLVVTATAMAIAYVVFATVPSYEGLLVTLFVFYAGSGAYDIGINGAAIGYEEATGRHVMTPLHAAFSGGGLVGALGAGVALALGVPFNLTYLAVPVLLAIAVLAMRAARLPGSGPRPHHENAAGSARRIGITLIVLCLGIVALTATVSEGALESWSAIYLRLTLGFPAELGVAGVAVFHGAMLIGRALGAPVVARLGRRRTLLAAGMLAAIAMPISLATTFAPLVLGGFFAVAIGLSVLFPVAVSMAGSLARGEHGRAASTVITIGYAGFVVGPAVIGAVAATVSLRAALLVVSAAGLLTVALALGLLRRIPEREAVAPM